MLFPRILKRMLALWPGIRATAVKTRKVYLKGNTRIHLDHVVGLGNYMELEIVLGPNDRHEDGITQAKTIMEELGIPRNALESQAYVNLLEKRDSLHK